MDSRIEKNQGEIFENSRDLSIILKTLGNFPDFTLIFALFDCPYR
jgi:hypothetical protein